MLTYKKNKASKDLKIVLTRKKVFFSKEMKGALLFASLLHLAGIFLFSITIFQFRDPPSLAPLSVSWEKMSSTMDPVIIKNDQNDFLSFLAHPPMIEIPEPIRPFQDTDWTIELPLSSFFQPVYFETGPESLTLKPTDFRFLGLNDIHIENNDPLFLPKNENVLLDIRIDAPAGKIIWYDWIKKSTSTEINRQITTFLKYLTIKEKFNDKFILRAILEIKTKL